MRSRSARYLLGRPRRLGRTSCLLEHTAKVHHRLRSIGSVHTHVVMDQYRSARTYPHTITFKDSPLCTFSCSRAGSGVASRFLSLTAPRSIPGIPPPIPGSACAPAGRFLSAGTAPPAKGLNGSATPPTGIFLIGAASSLDVCSAPSSPLDGASADDVDGADDADSLASSVAIENVPDDRYEVGCIDRTTVI